MLRRMCLKLDVLEIELSSQIQTFVIFCYQLIVSITGFQN